MTFPSLWWGAIRGLWSVHSIAVAAKSANISPPASLPAGLSMPPAEIATACCTALVLRPSSEQTLSAAALPFALVERRRKKQEDAQPRRTPPSPPRSTPHPWSYLQPSHASERARSVDVHTLFIIHRGYSVLNVLWWVGGEERDRKRVVELTKGGTQSQEYWCTSP